MPHRRIDAGARPATGRALDIVLFVALLATVLALGGALAHAYELPIKIGLPRDDYFTVQQIYLGWNRLGYVLAVQLVALVAAAWTARRERRVFWPVIAALACVGAAQAVFWTFTFPANVATQNWSTVTADWGALRVRWEYSHLAGAVLQLGALCALAVAALARGRG